MRKTRYSFAPSAHVMGEHGNYGKGRYVPVDGHLGERESRSLVILPILTRRQALRDHDGPYPSGPLYGAPHGHRTGCGHDVRPCKVQGGQCRAHRDNYATCLRCDTR